LSLLESYQELSERELQALFTAFLEDLSDHLMVSSPGAWRSPVGRSTVAETVAVFQLRRKNMVSTFLQHLRSFHANLTPPPSETQQWRDLIDDSGTLDLVDLNDFEDFLALERMVAIGEDLYRIPLEALQLRVAELAGVDPMLLRLPEHVAQLCRALQQVLEAFEVPHRVTPNIYDYFVTHFLRQLNSLYTKLNQHLATAGVRPDIETELRTGGSQLPKPDKPDKPDKPRHRESHHPPRAASQTPVLADAQSLPGDGANATPARPDHVSSVSRQQQLYGSVVEALNFKREAENAGAGVDSGPVATPQALVKALAHLQQSSEARQQLQRSGSTSEYLVAHAGDAQGLGAGISVENRNQLEMVDSLFNTIQSKLDVSTELKPALGNLQIPLARLALLEPHFFLDPEHPARSLVDKLAVLANSANFPNRMLETRVEAIIDNIVNNYDRDSGVFEQALAGVDKLAQQQALAHARNVERVVKAQEGKEKLASARNAVDAIVRETLPESGAPQILLDLIDNGWRDLMVLTHIKQGADSREWQEHLRTLDLLTAWLTQQNQGDVDDDLVVERSMEVEPFIDLLEQQASTALPGNVSIQTVLNELRSILSGEAPVVMATEHQTGTAKGEAATESRRQRIDKTSRLRRWVRRVEELKTGSWLHYHDKAGQRHRMQLAWISEDRGRFLFVNDRGQKVAELNEVQLARQLSRGAQPPAPADTLSAVDQSMYGTLEHVQRTLSFARNHDSLTHLINGDSFLEQVGRALSHAKQHRSQHAVLCLNIDHFTLVNEVYDRISGDQVLLEFSGLLAQLHSKKTSSARLAEDEFAVLLVDRDLEQASAIAEQIRSDIAQSSVDIDGEKVSFTVSIGVATILDHSPDVDRVMANAREAMRQAKELGRNRVEQHCESEETVKSYRHEQRRSREALEEALENERFILRAQPIAKTAVAGGVPSTRHYELLLAMRDTNGNLSSPQDFIDAAERYGFMTLVDRWVVREAFRWISSLMDAQKVVPNIAINLSGASVTDDAFLDYLFEQISEFGVGTNRLCFEITETGTIANLVKAADFVRAFRNIGCKFSIDDFGTGPASHNYLRELPVDYVKIDGSFITNIHQNRSDYAMARSINDLAHFLGQETIAESVENEAIIEKLQEIGVDYLQGWGIGRPKPLDEVALDLMSIEK
jgi:diguanylate cyclase (GGDEF)-like protein